MNPAKPWHLTVATDETGSTPEDLVTLVDAPRGNFGETTTLFGYRAHATDPVYAPRLAATPPPAREAPLPLPATAPLPAIVIYPDDGSTSAVVAPASGGWAPSPVETAPPRSPSGDAHGDVPTLRRGHGVRWWIILAIPAVGTAAFVKGTGVSTRQAASRVPVVEAQAPAPTIIRRTGQLRAKQPAKIRARVGGYVTKVAVREGQSVRAGDTLITLDPSQYAHDVERLDAEIAESRAELALARRRKAGLRLAIDGQLAPAAERHRIAKEVSLARARMKVARATARLAQDRLQLTTIVAPFDGRIIASHVQAGEVVAAGTEEGGERPPLLLLASSDDLFVRIDVKRSDFARVRLGQPALVTVAASSDRSFRGKVASLENTIEEGPPAETLPIEIRLDPNQDLSEIAPGTVAAVELDLTESISAR